MARKSSGWLHDLRRDLLYALRTLGKAPAFTAVAVLTLALGIGAVTVIYSVVHNVVVDPLPYRDAGRLVNVLVKDSQSPRVRGTFAVPEFVALREGTSAFEDVIGTLGQLMTYEGSDGVESLRGVWVTPNFFDFMGIAPLLGRLAGPGDATPDAPPVVVLRHRAWVRYFAADPGVVGRTILLNGERRTVVGVMPPRFTWHAADLWMPGRSTAPLPRPQPRSRNFQARLKLGVTPQRAEAELDAAAPGTSARLSEGLSREVPGAGGERHRVHAWVRSAVCSTPTLAAVATPPVDCLLQRREHAARKGDDARAGNDDSKALGAGRGRILRQLMVESLLFAMAGALFGCLFAYIGIGALVARLPQSPLPGEVDITLNTPVLLFSLGASCLIGHAVRPDAGAVHRAAQSRRRIEGRRTSGRRRWQRTVPACARRRGDRTVARPDPQRRPADAQLHGDHGGRSRFPARPTCWSSRSHCLHATLPPPRDTASTSSRSSASLRFLA